MTITGRIRAALVGVCGLLSAGLYMLRDTVHLPGLMFGSTTISAATIPRAVIPPQFFGLTVLDFTHLKPSIPFGTIRSWDAGPGLAWAEMNPSLGTYDFAKLDQYLEFSHAHGSEAIYTFGRTPRWASSQPDHTTPYGPGQCAPPARIAYWDAYVESIAIHAAGRVKYWELWNEPNEASYCGDIPTMVLMAQHAYRLLKAADPNAVILSPSADKASGPRWLSSFLAKGGAGSVDVIAFHGYWSAEAEDIIEEVARFRAVAAENGLSALPVWDTESSWAYTSTMPLPPSTEQVGFIAKSYLLHWSVGVARSGWYAYDGGTPWGTLSVYSAETPAALAYAETYRWMVGAWMTAPCAEAANKVWTCSLARGGGHFGEAVWISKDVRTYSAAARVRHRTATWRPRWTIRSIWRNESSVVCCRQSPGCSPRSSRSGMSR